MIARAAAPDKLGPSNVFPNVALWDAALDGMKGLPVICESIGARRLSRLDSFSP